jgi:NADH:ubiquinone oxidoreductase subunit F (NADH-binding)
MVAGVHPDLEARLVRPGRDDREDLDAYRRAGGYGAGPTGASLRAEVAASGLCGRGGAAFPAGVKWQAVAERPGRRSVVANGEEGEPTSHKDRYLLRTRPHLVLDGLLRAAEAVGADDAYVYLSDDAAAESVRAALDELERDGRPARDVEVVAVEPTYVAGEETAAIQAIAGLPALPTAKPPRPFESGVRGGPTLVQNVETLAHVPFIATHGSHEYRRVGTADAPGTFLLTAGGACGAPGVYELPLGVPLEEAFDAVAGGFADEPTGFVMGGYFAGLLGPRGAGLALDHRSLREAGSGLGCGAITVLGADECPVDVALAIGTYFAAQSAQQCGACINGTVAMRDALWRLAGSEPDPADVKRLGDWSVRLRGRGGCALLDGAATLVGSLLAEFPDDVAAHLDGACGRCRAESVQPTMGSVPWSR